ncbi:resolvase family protein [Saccharomonospora marina XMU15]|uniref:Resolvase family protein n=1 Tax=Saccharomonospora marina XMU15 TaxID=882083 RepID=H5X717_9PSEU|nr:resolvase family protein [Saccharomonospora marina XMU15]
MEDWAEIRRLYRAEGVPIKEIARRLGVARNTVRAALRSDGPPKYQRARRGSVADAYEPQIRALLREWPRMPTPVISQRIGWPYSEGPLKKLLARIRPEYVGIDPVDRVTYQPGLLTQCDLTAVGVGEADAASLAPPPQRRNQPRFGGKLLPPRDGDVPR